MLLLIESARGVQHAIELLAASERVETAIFGYVDFMLDLGIDVIDTSDTAEKLLYARSAMVMAARLAERGPPLDGPFIDIDDTEGLLRQCDLGAEVVKVEHPRGDGLRSFGWQKDGARRGHERRGLGSRRAKRAANRTADHPAVRHGRRGRGAIRCGRHSCRFAPW